MSSGISLAEAVDTYLAALAAEGAPHGTIKGYKTPLKRLCTHFPGRQYAGIKTKDLTRFLYGPGGLLVGKAHGTGVTYRSALRSFFGYGHLMGWGPETLVPAPAIRQRAGTRPRALPTRLNAKQLTELVDNASHPVLRGMLAVAANTALRISDVRSIRMRDIDLQQGTLFVNITKTGETDSKPITADLDEELRRYLQWLTAQVGVTVADHDAYIFPGRERIGSEGFSKILYRYTTTRPIGRSWAHSWLASHLRKCNITVETGEAWHVIRRSVARLYWDSIRGDVSHDHALRQVSALLNHKSTATTERYLGLQAEIEARDVSLRGQRFLHPHGEGVGGHGRQPAGGSVTPLRQSR